MTGKPRVQLGTQNMISSNIRQFCQYSWQTH